MDAAINNHHINHYNELQLPKKNLSSLIYRLKYGGGYKRQAITKAVGANPKRQLKVIDATCGFGTDAIVLAYFNCQVYAIEQHPKIVNLLINRLELAKQHKFLTNSIANIKLFAGNCIELIPKIINNYQFIPDVIYLDPMFNHTNNAATNKIIQTLQHIIVNEPLSENIVNNHELQHNLLKFMLTLAVDRIVVKRSRLAPYLDNIVANYSLIGKANRFDIYLPQ